MYISLVVTHILSSKDICSEMPLNIMSKLQTVNTLREFLRCVVRSGWCLSTMRIPVTFNRLVNYFSLNIYGTLSIHFVQDKCMRQTVTQC